MPCVRTQINFTTRTNACFTGNRTPYPPVNRGIFDPQYGAYLYLPMGCMGLISYHQMSNLVSCNRPPERRLSSARKSVLLLMFCFAQFLDVFNNAALIPAIPALENSMSISQSESPWIISAFQLTFASFLLISGRISDVYDPKKAFISGVSSLGIISIGAGFVDSKVALIVLRALMGVVSAMVIPSAFTLLVRVFPEPLEQARAIGIFGGCGAFGNVLGLFTGAALVQYASYHWVFWSVGIFAAPIAIGCQFLVPPEVTKSKNDADTRGAKLKSLDLIGVSILTIALILFIYAVTSGAVNGWAAVGVLTPLIISVGLIVVFFYWETLVPPENAAIPPQTWFYSNFAVLFGAALYPVFWWSAVFLVFTTLWQDVFQWTVMSTIVHMLPLGITGFVMSFTGALSRTFNAKWLILAGFLMSAVATLLLALSGSRPEDYFPYIFPAFALGAGGVMLSYTHTNIAIFQTTPTSMAGTVGAMLSGALECGSAMGLVAFISIQTSVEATKGGTQGRAAAFWFLFGITLIEILSISYFYHRRMDRGSEPSLVDQQNNTVSASGGNFDKTEEVKSDHIVMITGSETG